MGFFDNIFRKKEPAAERRLRHPQDLRKGDFVTFQFLPQQEVSGKTFEVSKVNTYTYDGVDYPEMILKNKEGDIIFMMVEEEDGEEYVGLSKKVPKTMIRDLIDQEMLDLIFARGTGVRVNLQSKPEELSAWLGDKYMETDEYLGHFSKGDARAKEFGQDERFRAYELHDHSDEFAIEIEVYGKEEVEMSLTVYHDINVIEEILPGSLEA